MVQKSKHHALPGDKIAIIEEYESGMGSYVEQEFIRASSLGESKVDVSNHTISINPSSMNRNIPRQGDLVIGQVEVTSGGIIGVRIHALNGKSTASGFSGIIMNRGNSSRGPRRGPLTLCKLGDLLRAKIISLNNAIISLTVEPEDCGVLVSSCSLCGSSVIRIDYKIKCVECGWVDDRKLSSDFGKPIIQ